MKHFHSLLSFLIAIAFTSCKKSDPIAEQLEDQAFEIEVDRFDLAFAKTNPQELQSLREKYPFFITTSVPDSVWTSKLEKKDTILNLLNYAVAGSSITTEAIERKLKPVLQRAQFLLPEYKGNKVYTVISEVDYNNKVNAVDEGLIVGIDNYLGADHELYQGIYDYQRNALELAYLPYDAAAAISQRFLEKPNDRSFLARMLYHGKIHYAQSILVPDAEDHKILNYTPQQLEFVAQNEVDMWKYFLDQSLLYSTATDLDSRFLDPAPFSKFYLEIDQETPGGAARYIAYRIVQSYMDENEGVSLEQLFKTNALDLFNKSKYKPSK